MEFSIGNTTIYVPPGGRFEVTPESLVIRGCVIKAKREDDDE